MKRLLRPALTAAGLLAMTLVLSCGIVYAQDEKPVVVSEPIPPVNVDMMAKEPEPEPEADSMPTEALEGQPPSVDKMGKPEIPKKREIDTDYDGRVDRIEIYDSEGRVARLDIDTDGDGIFEEWMIFEKGKPKINGKDRNKDGRTDTWIEY